MSFPSFSGFIGPWAPSVNYPVGPIYGGTPTKTAPPSTGSVGFSPGVIYNAQHFNYAFNIFTQQDLALAGAAQLDWQPPFSSGSVTTQAIAWNPKYRCWAQLYTSAGSSTAQFWTGQGQISAASGPTGVTPTTAPSSITCATDGQVYFATISGTGIVYNGLPTAASWATLTSLSTVSNIYVTYIGTNWVCIGTNSSGGTTQYVCGASATSAGAFSTTVAVAPTVNGWAVATNGTSTVVFVPRKTGPSSYVGTTSNVAASAQLAGLLGASDVPIDLVFTGSQFVLAVSVAGGTTTAFYATSDGLTWNALSTVTSFGTAFSGTLGLTTMRAIGQMIVALASGGSSHFAYTSYSLDGGATWYPGDLIFEISGGTTVFTALLAAGDNQFVIAAGSQAQLQFGSKIGTPSAPLT